MSHFWLIESLADLRAYAARNNLPALAEHLDTAIQLAHLELANKAANDTHAPTGDDAPDPGKRGPKDQQSNTQGSEDKGPESPGPDDPGPDDPGPDDPGPDNHRS